MTAKWARKRNKLRLGKTLPKTLLRTTKREKTRQMKTRRKTMGNFGLLFLKFRFSEIDAKFEKKSLAQI